MTSRNDENLSGCLNGPNKLSEWRSTIVLRLLRDNTGWRAGTVFSNALRQEKLHKTAFLPRNPRGFGEKS